LNQKIEKKIGQKRETLENLINLRRNMAKLHYLCSKVSQFEVRILKKTLSKQIEFENHLEALNITSRTPIKEKASPAKRILKQPLEDKNITKKRKLGCKENYVSVYPQKKAIPAPAVIRRTRSSSLSINYIR
jgi:hypothetical protein